MTPIVSGLVSLVSSALFNGSSSGDAKPSTPRKTDSVDGGPSAVLTLSADAAVLARFADRGVTATSRSFDTPLGVQRVSGGSPSADERKAVVSKEDFQKLLAEFGASDEEKATITAGFDADKDGAITHSEFLKGLAGTQGSRAHTDASQALMRLMDRQGNGNGQVSSQEFARFNNAFADVQARRVA